MDDDIEGALVRVRADTQGFARDIAEMQGAIDAGLGSAAERAGVRIESALLRAVRTGSLGFEDLKRVALAAMSEIAAGAIRSGLGALGGGGGIAGIAASLLGGVLGLPGRATGGPVSPGRAYVVGERGPELFVPTSSGRVETQGRGGRDVRVTVNVNAGGGTGAPEALARSGRQVARAVRAALAED